MQVIPCTMYDSFFMTWFPYSHELYITFPRHSCHNMVSVYFLFFLLSYRPITLYLMKFLNMHHFILVIISHLLFIYKYLITRFVCTKHEEEGDTIDRTQTSVVVNMSEERVQGRERGCNTKARHFLFLCIFF